MIKKIMYYILHISGQMDTSRKRVFNIRVFCKNDWNKTNRPNRRLLFGGCLVAVLYFYKLKHNPRDPKLSDQNRFILSKDHSVNIDVSVDMTLSVKAEVEPEKVYKTILGGLTGSNIIDAKVTMILSRNFKPFFRIDPHIKDLQNTLNAGHDLNTFLILTHGMEIMQALKADEEAVCYHNAITNFYEKISDMKIKKITRR